MSYYDYDPNKSKETLSQSYTIPNTAPYVVYLQHIPKQGTISISGFSEVTTSPNSGEFKAEYGVSGKGLITFNSANAGQTITINYNACGTVMWAEDKQNIEGFNSVRAIVDDSEQDLHSLNQVVEQATANLVREQVHSGVLDYSSEVTDAYHSINQGGIATSDTQKNTNLFHIGDFKSIIDGYKLDVALDNYGKIKLPDPPSEGERDDLVFLEAWKEEVTLDSPVSASRVSSKIEWKWRIRTVAGVDFEKKWNSGNTTDNECQYIGWNDGLVHSNIFSQGGNSQPLTCSNAHIDLFATTEYKRRREDFTHIDKGLWVAGEGNQASKDRLLTADGYSYAIPLFRVKRRNNGGYSESNPNGARDYFETYSTDSIYYLNSKTETTFSPNVDISKFYLGQKFKRSNSNVFEIEVVNIDTVNNKITVYNHSDSNMYFDNAQTMALKSDRPDNLYSNIIDERDIIDLRHHISLNGFDYQQLLEENFDKLLRGELQTKDKTKMVKTYHGIRKTPIDSNTVFYASFDGTLAAEIGGSPSSTGVVNFNPSITGLGLQSNDEVSYSVSLDKDVLTLDLATNFKNKTTGRYEHFLQLEGDGNKLFRLWHYASKLELDLITPDDRTAIYSMGVIPITEVKYIRIRIDLINNTVRCSLNGGQKSYYQNLTGNEYIYTTPIENIYLFPDFIEEELTISDFSISSTDRGDTFATLPNDFIEGYARIEPTLSDQRLNLSDAEIIQPTTAFALGEGLSNSKGVTVSQTTSGSWANGDTITIKGLAGETIGSNNAPTVKFDNAGIIESVVGTWSGLGTDEVTFTLGDINVNNPALEGTGSKLEINYELECERGNGGLPEVYTETLAGEYNGKKLVKGYTAVVDDFKGKVKGSTVENPNYGGHGDSDGLISPQNFNYESEGTSNYSNYMNLDSNLAYITTSILSYIPQQLFSFDLIRIVEDKFGTIPSLDKVQWLKDNLSKITFNWWGYGKRKDENGDVIDYRAIVDLWRSDTNSWYGYNRENTAGNVSKTYLDLDNENVIKNRITDDGKLHFIAYVDPVSVEGGTSTIYTDYCNIEVELKADKVSYDYLVPENPRRDGGMSNVLMVRKETKELQSYFPVKSNDKVATWGDYVPSQNYNIVGEKKYNYPFGYSTTIGTGAYNNTVDSNYNKSTSYLQNLDLSQLKHEHLMSINGNDYLVKTLIEQCASSNLTKFAYSYDRFNFVTHLDIILSLIEVEDELYLRTENKLLNSTHFNTSGESEIVTFKLQGRPLIKGGN